MGVGAKNSLPSPSPPLYGAFTLTSLSKAKPFLLSLIYNPNLDLTALKLVPTSAEDKALLYIFTIA